MPQSTDPIGSSDSGGREPRYAPAREEVEQLIQRAEAHPLGTDFLRRGALDAVASTFGVHAFVVDSARDRLGRR